LNSPRGVPESNGRAVISALRTLQSKIREMESSKTASPEITPRSETTMTRKYARANSIGTDSESVSNLHGLLAHANDGSSKSGKTFERSAALEAELSQADERCKILEEKLADMRLAFVRAEVERNKETEARIRSERERIALTGIYSPIAAGHCSSGHSSPFSSPRAQISTSPPPPTHLPLPKLNLGRDSAAIGETPDDLQLDEINIRYRSNSGEKTSPSPTSSSYKVNLRNIPFCAGKSTQPSHNVGLNIQGLLHQIKTQRNNKTANKTPIPSSSGETDTDNTETRATSSEIVNLEELLVDLQREFGEITLSCRATDVKVDILQKRLVQLEKKGQQILVVKKLLKKKQRELFKTPTSSRRSVRSSQKSGGARSAQNRVLLREVKKVTSAMTSDDCSWR